MYYVFYMCVVLGVVYVLWKSVLCFQNYIVLNSVVFWTSVLHFGQVYHVLDTFIVL